VGEGDLGTAEPVHGSEQPAAIPEDAERRQSGSEVVGVEAASSSRVGKRCDDTRG
jgi:hypothetical protein